ncbi:peptidoglycan D,D-transpeptidase FtsI family protein [Ferrovibrio sp.]|jgi:cell division protein FtsI (penicillin-binding protein 3)|uniref:peptidoglycan D,D-transpeptidase FtsI family protein n=1 Tax=Ferrovibrio sp. TaxID=1917215 RepID=UPI0035B1781E
MALFRRQPKPKPPCTPADIPGNPGLVRLEGAAKQALEASRGRLVIGIGLFSLAFIVLAGRLVELTVLRGATEPVVARGVNPELIAKTALMERQPIVDRNGNILATNLKIASLYADPRKVLNPVEAATRLAQALPELPAGEVQAKLASGKSFVWLKRGLTPREQYEVNRLGIPGLYFHNEQRRVYPQGPMAVHVLGYTDIDGKGISGVEQYFDEQLRDPSRTGDPLELSIDIRVQHVVRDEVAKAVEFFNAIGGGGIVLDVYTGEVIAMVSLPDFDPAEPGTASKDSRFNRITLGVYEMGSTMKTLNTAMALDYGTVKLSSGYDATHPIQISRFTIKDDHPKKRWLSVPEIFMYSSNIGSAKMAVDVGPERQREFMQRMGMLNKPAIELPEVGGPLVPRNWKTVETMTISFGHGLSVTPLQLASATAAIVNGGVLHPPTLIKRPPGLPAPGRQVIRRDVSDVMRKLMLLVVEEGTGKKAEVDGYLVGGKTGSSEKVNERGGYNKKANFNTFVAGFPMHNPRYIVQVMIDEPKGNKSTYGFATAGWTAAPAAGRIISRIAPLLGVPPVDESSPALKQAMYVPIPGQPVPNFSNPNVTVTGRTQEKKLASQ